MSKTMAREFTLYVKGNQISRSMMDAECITVREVLPGCSQCQGVILADTEDWPNPLCYSCYSEHFKSENKIDWERLAKMMAEALEFYNQSLKYFIEGDFNGYNRQKGEYFIGDVALKALTEFKRAIQERQ